ncbi:MAG: phosphoglucosamine mutase [Peptococcaceae bacterium]|jgi:phosphoglucosamine mutase|nr:phosphoglucosamine mutase [Peptococcaceae bacterium]
MRYFGTDGVRGAANQELTPELAFHLGLACGTVLKREMLASQMIVGRDSRLSGPMLQGALTAGFCSAGINVYDAGVLPTPAVAYLAGRMADCAGAVVSASHNPAGDNGIKFLGSRGDKLEDDILEAVERLIDEPPAPAARQSGRAVGWVKPLTSAAQDYVSFLLGTLDCSLTGLKVVVDCANGAAWEVGPRALRQAGAQAISIHDLPDGWNINQACGSTHMESLRAAVTRWGADLGAAFDGDGDRFLAVDHQSRLVDGDQILVALGLYLREQGRLGDQVVVTVMSNLGLRLAFEAAGITVRETPVGDRYVLQEMLRQDALLGGEQSGHIILREFAATGDGILSALQLMAVMKKTGKTLAELSGQMRRYPQVLINVPVKTKEGWESNPAIAGSKLAVEEKLAGRGRLLLRPSGTEPLIRVMAEGPDEKELRHLLSGLTEVIGAEQGLAR